VEEPNNSIYSAPSLALLVIFLSFIVVKLIRFFHGAFQFCCLNCSAGDMASVPNGHDMAGGDADSVAVIDSSSSALRDDSKSENDSAEPEKSGESGEEVVVIQDTGFNISIVAPGVEPFDLPVCC